MDLYRLLRRVHRRVTGIVFRHTGFRVAAHVLIFHPVNPIVQQSADIQLRIYLGHMKLDRLESADRLPVEDPFIGKFTGFFIYRL